MKKACARPIPRYQAIGGQQDHEQTCLEQNGVPHPQGEALSRVTGEPLHGSIETEIVDVVPGRCDHGAAHADHSHIGGVQSEQHGAERDDQREPEHLEQEGVADTVACAAHGHTLNNLVG